MSEIKGELLPVTTQHPTDPSCKEILLIIYARGHAVSAIYAGNVYKGKSWKAVPIVFGTFELDTTRGEFFLRQHEAIQWLATDALAQGNAAQGIEPISGFQGSVEPEEC